MSEPYFSSPDDARAYLRGLWGEAMREVPETRRPRAMHSGWPLGVLPRGVADLPVQTEAGSGEHRLAASGFYALAPIADTGHWGLYQEFGPVVQLLAPLVTSFAVFGDAQPVPPVAARVLGADGIGILLDTDTDTGPGRR